MQWFSVYMYDVLMSTLKADQEPAKGNTLLHYFRALGHHTKVLSPFILQPLPFMLH